MVGLGEEDELEEGELRGADREGAGTIYECEKCKKVSVLHLVVNELRACCRKLGCGG